MTTIINRRELLAGTAAAVSVVALPDAALPAALTIRELAVRAMASADHFAAAITRLSAANKLMEPFRWEPWTATRGSPAERWILNGEKLRSTAQAKQVFSEARTFIQQTPSDEEPGLVEYNARIRQMRLAKLEEYEREALEYLGERERAWKVQGEAIGLDAIDQQSELAGAAFDEAMKSLLAAPCASFGDVKMKVLALLHAVDLGVYDLDVGDEDIRSLLLSFAGKASDEKAL